MRGMNADGARSEMMEPKVPKEVLAFYYGWYANPTVSGRWFHWKEVDTAAQHIGECTHYPARGPYDSHDRELVEAHFLQAQGAGLTGFIVSWWAQGDFHDDGLPLMLEVAGKHNLKVSVYYETVPPRGKPSADGAHADLAYITERYGNHPAWLKVHDQPVVFIFKRALQQLKLHGWKKVIADFRANQRAAVFIGDRISAPAASIFDGIHTYNPTEFTHGKSLEDIRHCARKEFFRQVKTAGPDRIACVTIIPGYDDSVQPSRKPPRPITDRFEGATYRALWEEAIAANPDWILVTSWNEWHEGSEIEPSQELGDRELKSTPEFAHRFLSNESRSTRASDRSAGARGRASSGLRELSEHPFAGEKPDGK